MIQHTGVSNREMNIAWQFIANTGMSVFLTGKAAPAKPHSCANSVNSSPSAW